MSFLALFPGRMGGLPAVLLALSGCQRAAPAAPPTAPTAPAASVTGRGGATPTSSSAAGKPRFQCSLLLGVAVTSEWFEAGFERVVDGARWEAITKPHTSLDQWADPNNSVWSQSPSSPCTEHAQEPDRVLFTGMNWEYTTAAEWQTGLTAVVQATLGRFPNVREIELLTMIRAPGNTSCGNAMSVVQPFVDEAMRAVAAQFPERVRVGPKLEVPSCEVFKNGGPHFTDAGRGVVAQRVGEYFAREP